MPDEKVYLDGIRGQKIRIGDPATGQLRCVICGAGNDGFIAVSGDGELLAAFTTFAEMEGWAEATAFGTKPRVVS